MRDNPPCNDRVDEEDRVVPASRKSERRDNTSPLLHLIRSCRDGCSQMMPNRVDP